MKLLLDTCTFIWYITDDKHLPQSLKKMISLPDHDVYLSAVSIWEIVVKQQLGKIKLPNAAGPVATFIAAQREAHGIESMPLNETDITFLEKLPKNHRDPYDRMLICQALQNDATIVTPDDAIHSYPVKVMW